MKLRVAACAGRFALVMLFTSVALIPGKAGAERLILSNARIYTADLDRPWADTLVIDGDRIVVAGRGQDLAPAAGDHVVDVKGHLIIPGIIDSHVHSMFGAMALHGLNLWTSERSITADQPQAFEAALRDYAVSHKNESIVFVRAVFATVAPDMPDKYRLDRVISDRPVIVHNVSEHALWLNSKALALAGISRRVAPDADEQDGIVRDTHGEPTGILLEAAMELAERAVLHTLSEAQKLAMLREGFSYLNSFGITSAVNATGNLAEIELYGALRDRHELTVRTRTAFGAVAVQQNSSPALLADLETARTRYHDAWVSANLVKFFADGASGREPKIVYQPERYRELVEMFDRLGYQVMTHALRADSVHRILDVYGNLDAKNGVRDRRLRIEHGDLVDDQDVPRFAAEHVIASMQPAFCCGSPAGPITERWRSLRDRATTLVFSSDWPCTWPPNPYVAMQQASTRAVYRGAGYGAAQGNREAVLEINAPQERITVAQALDAYTRDAAYANFMEQDRGTLTQGKFADLAILSDDLFTVAPDRVGKVTVLATLVGGHLAYGAFP